MEYAGGGELYTYIHENGKLNENVAKSLIAQVISAVAHLVSHYINLSFLIFSTPNHWSIEILKLKM
jgi:serine/threonine protein kinase